MTKLMSQFSKVKIGEVSIVSGSVLITDPVSIGEDWITNRKPSPVVYQHKDGSYWQYTGQESDFPVEPIRDDVNSFPGSYETVIPKYGKSPSELIKTGELQKVRIVIGIGEFSQKGCEDTLEFSGLGGELRNSSGDYGAGVIVNYPHTYGRAVVYAIVNNTTGTVSRIIIQTEEEEEEQLDSTQESIVKNLEDYIPIISEDEFISRPSETTTSEIEDDEPNG